MNSRNSEHLWRDVPPPFRSVARWLTIVQVVGYTTPCFSSAHPMAPSGISDRYRGSAFHNRRGDAVAKSYAEMSFSPHILSMAVIFAFSGLG
jgi:hypothetical protein